MGKNRSHVTVIVPAAGQGSRLGGERKQFRTLNGRPILVHTLRALRDCSEVNSLVVAVPPEDREHVSFHPELRVQVVAGGNSRQETVACAMKEIPADTEYVLIHDAVRPFITPAQVSAVICAAKSTGAAALAVPATDTMRYGSNGRFGATIVRSGLYHTQTPQGFRREVLESVLAAAKTTETDEVALVQRIGHPVAIVPGSRHNIKITTLEDWEWTKTYWPQWEMRLRCA